MNGTFYVPVRNNERPVMSATVLNEIADKYEIGCHTVNHLYLNSLNANEANYEISESKTILQNQLGRKIDAFCYPGGKYSERDINLVKQSGFLFGRTTRLFHITPDIQPFLLDTSVQVYNHSSATLVKHCMKNTFFLPIIQNPFFSKGNRNFPKQAEILFDRILTNGGVFHLWGHSWEIDEYDLWKDLEVVLKMLAFNQGAVYLNNTECWKTITSNKSVDS